MTTCRATGAVLLPKCIRIELLRGNSDNLSRGVSSRPEPQHLEPYFLAERGFAALSAHNRRPPEVVVVGSTMTDMIAY
ncbi:MAG: hypothetical protein ACKOGQ_01760, partial [Actinomycetota bacterium]